MNRQQSIGSNNQRQGLPANRKEQVNPAEKDQLTPQIQQPEKPAVTDDAGNLLDKKNEDAGKGYSESKQTEAWSNVKANDDTTASAVPSKQDIKTEEVYGEGAKTHHPNLHHDKDFPEQLNQEEKDKYEKRIRQSGNVPG